VRITFENIRYIFIFTRNSTAVDHNIWGCVAEELIPLLNERAGFPPDTELILYEEIKPNMVERIENYNEPLEKVLEELMDGDIIVFQKDERDDLYELPTCRDYFR
jgi:ubiquitin carboxyl-terminal hydrolase 7